MNLSIQFLTVSQITPALFVGFVRRQQVKRCWRKESGRWVLKDIAFLDDWSPADYTHLLQKLRAILLSGGAVLAAFDGEILAGFAAVTNEPFGPAEEYLQLSELNVSQPLRGQGIGRELYTVPFIWVPAVDKDGKPNYNTDSRGKPKLVLTVIELEAEDNRIKTISICNGKKMVYHWGRK